LIFDFDSSQEVKIKLYSTTDLKKMKVNYVDSNGKTLLKSEEVYMYKGDPEKKVDAPEISGLEANPTSHVIKFSDNHKQEFDFVYNKNTGAEVPNIGDDNSSNNENNNGDTVNSGDGNTSDKDGTSSTGIVATAVKPFKVYGKQKLYRYSHATFTNNRRVQAHAKKVKAHAPVFTVVGKTTSKNGAARYKLDDGTHITAKSNYDGKLYWLGNYKKMHVTNAKGINTYKSTTFSKKQKHVKQGTTVKVKKVTSKNGMTRYQLANGQYITGNKKFVSPTKPKQVKRVKAKTTVRVYKDVNLNKVVKTYKKGSVINVKGWDHSRGDVHHVSGVKRYKVAGGYITANSKYVKIAQ